MCLMDTFLFSNKINPQEEQKVDRMEIDEEIKQQTKPGFCLIQ